MNEELFKWQELDYVQQTISFYQYEKEYYNDRDYEKNFSNYKVLHENLGLVFKVGFELSGGSYQFNEALIFEKDNAYYLATDAGCSCPEPLENYSSIEDFTGPLNLQQAVEETTNLFKTAWKNDDSGDLERDFKHNMKEFIFNEMIDFDNFIVKVESKKEEKPVEVVKPKTKQEKEIEYNKSIDELLKEYGIAPIYNTGENNE